jgi:hypothetical protein
MDSPATQVAAVIEQVLPNTDTPPPAAVNAHTTLGLIAQTPVIVETPDTSSFVSEATRA